MNLTRHSDVLTDSMREEAYKPVRPVVSIDLETTGLNAENCLVLEFGAVIEDYGNLRPVTELPTYRRILIYDRVYGEPFAMWMNRELLKSIANDRTEEHIVPNLLGSDFSAWLVGRGFPITDGKVKIVPMGKNFGGFDLPFLRGVPKFFDHIHVSHRSLDPGSVWFNPAIDVLPPGLPICLERAGLPATVPHDAVEDAILVIKALRCRYSLPI